MFFFLNLINCGKFSGPSFVPSTGPPPKPAPPSFPNSPAISPANKIQPPVVPAVHPITSTPSMGKFIFYSFVSS